MHELGGRDRRRDDTLTVTSGSGAIVLNGVKGTAGLTLTTSGTETLNAGTYDVDDGAAYTFAAPNGGLTLNGSLVLCRIRPWGADAGQQCDAGRQQRQFALSLGAVTGGGTDTLTVTSGSGAIVLNGVKGTAGLTLTTSGTETLNAGTYDVDDGAAYTFAAPNGGLTLNGSLVLSQNTTLGA